VNQSSCSRTGVLFYHGLDSSPARINGTSALTFTHTHTHTHTADVIMSQHCSVPVNENKFGLHNITWIQFVFFLFIILLSSWRVLVVIIGRILKINDMLQLNSSIILHRSRGSSGSIVSDYGLDDRAIEVRSPAGAKDSSSNLCVQTGSGAHPASCTMGTGGPFPGGKARPGRNADHSLPSSAEVENE
jgi:hypothetical protein